MGGASASTPASGVVTLLINTSAEPITAPCGLANCTRPTRGRSLSGSAYAVIWASTSSVSPGCSVLAAPEATVMLPIPRE